MPAHNARLHYVDLLGVFTLQRLYLRDNNRAAVFRFAASTRYEKFGGLGPLAMAETLIVYVTPAARHTQAEQEQSTVGYSCWCKYQSAMKQQASALTTPKAAIQAHCKTVQLCYHRP
jgi:hypothetical protein